VASLDTLLDAADVVTLHVPETPQTYHMISGPQLQRMKPGARLINAARGTVVDIDALVAALDAKHLSGAALDVFPEEPRNNKEEFHSPLRKFDNVILTPHVGGSTEEAQQSIGVEVAGKLIKYSNNGSTLSAVNFPEVSLPEHPGKHRLLHIHRNQPGVLSRLFRTEPQYIEPVSGDPWHRGLRGDRRRDRGYRRHGNLAVEEDARRGARHHPYTHSLLSVSRAATSPEACTPRRVLRITPASRRSGPPLADVRPARTPGAPGARC